MAKLSVGFNFTEEHFETLLKLIDGQEKKPSQICSVYGSPGQINEFGSVRETYREANPTFEDMEGWLLVIRECGIEVNLAFNSLTPLNPIIHQPTSIDCIARDILNFVKPMRDLVDNWIVSHPGIIDLMLKEVPHEKVIVSTIMNVHTLPQLQWIRDNWPNVVRVCPAIERNRNFKWLAKANGIIELELLANEFCSMGGVDCEGLYRQICYMTQSLKLPGWKARYKCMEQRLNKPLSWMRSRFILPQWIPAYKEEIGIDNFKITGRTHGPEFLEYIANAYMNEKAEGNLLALWGQLESTMPGVDQQEQQELRKRELNIPIELFEKFDFRHCFPDYCGLECRTCEFLWKHYEQSRANDARSCQ